MKLLKVFLFVTILWIPNFVFATTGFVCNLDDLISGVVQYEECTHLSISSNVDVDRIPDSGLYFMGIEINNADLNDLSFLSKFETEYVEIHNSNVNLDNFNIQVPTVKISNSNIKNDDLSGLKNNLVLEKLSINNCWIKHLNSIEELSNLKKFSSFSIIENGASFIDLSYVSKLTNLTHVEFRNMEYNVTDDLIRALNKIDVDTSEISSGPQYSQQLLQMYNSIGLDGLTDEEKIRKIAIFVSEHMTYEVVDGNMVEAVIAGKGVCAHYSLLTNILLELAGFTTFDVGGYTNTSDPYNSTHAWNIVYYNGEWLAIDTTWLDNPDSLNRLKNGENVEYFMVPISSGFKDDHIMNSKVNLYLDYPYEVSYYSDGDVILTDFIGFDKSSFTFYTPTKEGYTFDGWFYDLTLTKMVNNVDEINKNVRLYAKWTAVPVNESQDDESVSNSHLGIFIILSVLVLCVTLIVILCINNGLFIKKVKKS